MEAKEIRNYLQELLKTKVGTFKNNNIIIPAIWIGSVRHSFIAHGLEIQIPEVPERISQLQIGLKMVWTFYLILHKDVNGKFTNDILSEAVQILNKNLNPVEMVYLPNLGIDKDTDVRSAVSVSWTILKLNN